MKHETKPVEKAPKPSMHQVPPPMHASFYTQEKPFYETYTPLVAHVDQICANNEKSIWSKKPYKPRPPGNKNEIFNQCNLLSNILCD